MKKALFYAFLIFLAMALPIWAGLQVGSGGGAASEVYVDNSVGGWTGTNAQTVFEEIQTNLDALVMTSTGIDPSAYNATTWDGSLLGACQDAIRDKFVALEATIPSNAAHYLTDQAEGSLSAEVVVSANGKSLITAANYAAMRVLLDLEPGVDYQAYDADLSTYAGITPSATIQTFLTSLDASTARNNLGLAIGSNVQQYDLDLTSLAGGITGLVKGAGNGGGYAAAVAGTDYVAVDADLTSIAGGITGIVKGAGNGSGFSAAVAGTDYLAPAAIGVTVQGLDADLTALAGISGSRGDIIYYGAGGWTRLPKGTENYILKQGANDPAWAENTGGSGASAFADLTDIAVNENTAGPLWWSGTEGRAIKAGVPGSYLKSDGTFDTPAGAGDMLAASYPNIVALESQALTNTYMLVANGSGWISASPADVRTNLGLVISTNVQAYDADLTTYAGITPSANVQSLLACADYSAMRTALSLVPGTNVQAYDADLATWAGVTPSSNGQSLVAAADYSAMRTLLSLVPGTNVQAYDADLATLAAPTANRIYYSNGSQAQTAIALGAANTVFVGNGTTSAPSFRSLTTSDLPTVTPSIGGTGVANNAASTITITGAYALTLTLSNTTSVTLPTSGTLATLAGSEALTNKSVNGITLAGGTYTLTVSATGTAALTSNNLSVFAATTSAQLAGVLSDESGDGGGFIRANNATLVAPTLGAATFTTLVQSGQTIGSNIIVTSGFAIDADGDVTGKTFTTTQQASTASSLNLWAAESTPSGLYAFLRGPSAAPTGGSYGFQFATTLPSAGQSFKFGTVDSRVVPLGYTTYLELSGGTMTGKLITAASTSSVAGLNIPSGTAPSSPTAGDLYYDGTHLYFYTTSAIDLLAGGGATLSNISNPSASKSFTMGAYTLAFTSSTATWGGVTISNTAADPSAGALLSLGYTADGDAQTMFLLCVDNNSGDTKFSVGQNGNTVIGGTLALTGDLTITGDDLFMATNTAGYILVGDDTNYNPVAVSGDLTLASSGAFTIADNAVQADDIEDMYGYEVVPVEWCTGGVSAPDATDSSTRGPWRYRTFSNSADEDLNFVWQIPSDATVGASANNFWFRVHYLITASTAPTTDEGVAFSLAGVAMGNSDATNAAKGTAVTVTDDLSSGYAQWDYVVTDWSSAVTLTGAGAGEMVEFNFERTTGDAADDYGQVVGVAFIEVRYVKNPTR